MGSTCSKAKVFAEEPSCDTSPEPINIAPTEPIVIEPKLSAKKESVINVIPIDEYDDDEEEEEPPLLTLRPFDSSEGITGQNNSQNGMTELITTNSYSDSDSDALSEYNFLNYTAIRVVGSGASSTVVQMVKDGVIYAVKVCDLKKNRPAFLRADAADPQAEAVILKKFDFPFVLKIFDFCAETDTDRFFIVMEYLDGDISKCKTNSQKKTAFVQAALALNYIHNQRIAHRDIKIENILMHRDGSVRLADFGISEFIPEGQEKVFLSIKGTLAYSAPEIYGELPYNPFLSDIWALGITLYNLMFKKLPFTASKIGELKEKIEKDVIVFPKDANPKLVDLINIMTKKNPDERTSLEKIIEHPWVQKAKSRIDINRLMRKPKSIYKSISEYERKESIHRIISSKNFAAM